MFGKNKRRGVFFARLPENSARKDVINRFGKTAGNNEPHLNVSSFFICLEFFFLSCLVSLLSVSAEMMLLGETCNTCTLLSD